MRLAPLTPYLAVLVGLDGFESGWLAFGLYHVGIVTVLALAGRLRMSRSLLAGWHSGVALMAVSAGAAGGLLIWALWPQLGAASDLRARLGGIGLAGTAWTTFVAYHVLINPWLEELFWRGLLGGAARHPTVSDVAFAGYHILVLVRFVAWPWPLVAFAVLVGAAWTWRRIADCFGGLLIPVLSHMSANAGILLAVDTMAGR